MTVTLEEKWTFFKKRIQANSREALLVKILQRLMERTYILWFLNIYIHDNRLRNNSTLRKKGRK